MGHRSSIAVMLTSFLLVPRQSTPAGTLLGFILFRLTLDGDDDTETLYVYELQVAETARRLGLGKHLMQVWRHTQWHSCTPPNVHTRPLTRLSTACPWLLHRPVPCCAALCVCLRWWSHRWRN